MTKYTDGEILYLKFICSGKTTHEIADIFNKNFGRNITRNQLKSLMQNYGIKSGIDRAKLNKNSRLLNDEQDKFLRSICKGKTTFELTELINKQFETEFTQPQIKGYMSRYKITNGLDCRIKKGNIPQNKGKKVIPHPNSIATQFKKGERPRNYMPVGTERINTDGYVEIKIKDPNIWKAKHHIIWEEHNGKIPEGYAIIFADRNKQNLDINNLVLVTRSQLLIMNHNRLISDNAEFTRTGVIISNLIGKIKEVEKKLNTD